MLYSSVWNFNFPLLSMSDLIEELDDLLIGIFFSFRLIKILNLYLTNWEKWLEGVKRIHTQNLLEDGLSSSMVLDICLMTSLLLVGSLTSSSSWPKSVSPQGEIASELTSDRLIDQFNHNLVCVWSCVEMQPLLCSLAKLLMGLLLSSLVNWY